MTIGNLVFCLAFCLTGLHFRGKLQHVGYVSEQKQKIDHQSELKKEVVSDCKTNYMGVRGEEGTVGSVARRCSVKMYS